MKNLGLIMMPNCEALGTKVERYLQEKYQVEESLQINLICNRFQNGEGKVRILDSVRDKDLYILTDVGNHGMTYSMYGKEHEMSPDEHYQDLKRVISACSGKASRITVIMPLLYQSRQHKRRGRESLDCALALQELERLGVSNILTFDCHDPNVANAVPNMSFENIYPTKTMVQALKTIHHPYVISPDMGAMERARHYAEMLGSKTGVFYKRRDLTQVIQGKNPILEHVYLGSSVKGKDVIVVDDMIASGTSMIEVAKELRSRGARKIVLCATFALFTEGTKAFEDAYHHHVFDQLYTTNLSYLPDRIKKQKWCQSVDFSGVIGEVIDTLSRHDSLQTLEVIK